MTSFIKFIDRIRTDKWWGRYFIIYGMFVVLIDLLTLLASFFFA